MFESQPMCVDDNKLGGEKKSLHFNASWYSFKKLQTELVVMMTVIYNSLIGSFN